MSEIAYLTGRCPILGLTRHIGEKIYIGDDICITVLGVDRGKVRLGVEAPRSVPIYRQELLPISRQLELQKQFSQKIEKGDEQ